MILMKKLKLNLKEILIGNVKKYITKIIIIIELIFEKIKVIANVDVIYLKCLNIIFKFIG